MQRLQQWLTRLSACAVVALFASMLLVGTASAHSHYQSSTPADGAVLTAQPDTISATYTEETSLTDTKFDVYYATDSSAAPRLVASGKVDVNDRTKVSATLPAGLGDGVYTVKWHTVTEDDNGMLDGTFSFKVGSGQPPASTGSTSGGAGPVTGSTNGSASPLPQTGNPASALPLLGLLVALLLSAGFALRRRPVR
jgi:LPXTG-motif cell wall-anchored protein